MSEKKYLDQKLAERLFPVYCENGGKVVAVYDHCRKEGIEISKPTLGKMADVFFWKTKYEEKQQSEFAANTGNDPDSLLNDLTIAKNKVKPRVFAMAFDREAHDLFGRYIGLIQKVQAQKIAAQAVDKDRLLIEALKGVVEFFKEQDEQEMVRLIGENLETIGEKVREKWQRKS